ncbi:SRPBCC family protein [Pseudofrankia inefficax]|uniref:Activator of Hsp90 ATPase 1 family protein n=1 Tax=Pseudofrankia inefficax (strain DSM 45817 / CECT 9037 / DDB 130130 / EuI1c) TaxID=298654 RepID=E3IWA2_PSEI1|nr:SRPBCC domain-containing protein [Pseudofrankia inefficax]ADP78944.1 Activator of Hsp90 ATPase 1 family protein [Pseudofrankia inefficax]
MADLYATEIDIDAPVEDVFRHLTDPAHMIRWMGQHATLDPTPGGTFHLDINGVAVRGHYRIVEPPHRIVVTWGVAGSTDLPPGTTEVEFTLNATPTGTRLRLEHRNLPDTQTSAHATGWNHFLDRLQHAATGHDPGPDPWQ